MVSEANVLERKQFKVLKISSTSEHERNSILALRTGYTIICFFFKQTGEQKKTIVMVINVILEVFTKKNRKLNLYLGFPPCWIALLLVGSEYSN